MAERKAYTCDRCGEPTSGGTGKHAVELDNWLGDGSREPGTIEMVVRIGRPSPYHTEKIDLCDDCQRDVLGRAFGAMQEPEE
jgi:hypothetical protein